MIDKIASLLYYDAVSRKNKDKDPKDPFVRFEDLKEDMKEKYKVRATEIISIFEKANLEIVDAIDHSDDYVKRIKSKNDLTILINKFLKKLTKPEGVQKVVNLMPVEELVAQIMAGA